MRKLITIPLLVLYLLTSLGFYGVSHFCGDELIDVALYTSDKKVSCQDDACCSIPQPYEECCTEINFTLYFESEKALIDLATRFLVKTPVAAIESNYNENIQEIPLVKWKPDDGNNSGVHTSTPLYLRHQSLIFYG